MRFPAPQILLAKAAMQDYKLNFNKTQSLKNEAAQDLFSAIDIFIEALDNLGIADLALPSPAEADIEQPKNRIYPRLVVAK